MDWRKRVNYAVINEADRPLVNHTFGHSTQTMQRVITYADAVAYYGPMGCETGIGIRIPIPRCTSQVVVMVKKLRVGKRWTSQEGAHFLSDRGLARRGFTIKPEGLVWISISPYWISYFRFGRKAFPLVSLDSLTPKTGGSRWNCVSIWSRS
jgi:hypothetical protein